MSTVLVVEDNPAIRNMYGAGLSGFGYVVAEASNVDDAISYMASHEVPSIILLDLRLPGRSGRDLIQHIRQDLRRSDVKIIVVSATLNHSRDVLDMGIDASLSKPVDLRQLLGMIQQYAPA